jgi:uncharacterized protein (TIGR00266 family)
MQEHIEYNPSYTLLTVQMDAGEAIKVEPGGMAAMAGCEMETKSSGGFFKGLKKALVGGESFFLNTFTAGPSGGWISLAPGAPGDIKWFDLEPGQELFIQSGSFLACTTNVEFDTKFEGFKGFFSGESLFFIRAWATGGSGRIYYNSYGAMKEIAVQPGQIVTVDTGHLVAYESGLDYQINKVGGMKSLMFGGEGLVMNFSGQGTIWIQTRNIPSLAGLIIPFMPQSSSD